MRNPKLNKWGLVRQAFVKDTKPYEDGKLESIHSLTFGSNLRYIDEPDDLETIEYAQKQGDVRKEDKKMSFFKAVTEAKKLNCEGSKAKRERPTLLKFLDKFKTIDIPEDITPNNPNSNACFSHFIDTIDGEDEEALLLKKSLDCVAGESRELAAPQFKNNFDDWKTVIISIAGKEFRTKMKNLRRYPKSRLGKISLAKSKDEVLELCDGFVPGNPPVLFFYRNPQNFRTILDVYRRKEIHVCEQNCALIVQEDFEYWGLEEIFLQPCCALKYFPQTVSAQTEKHEEDLETELAEQRVEAENFGNSWTGIIRTNLWDMMEYPETSKAAQVAAFTSMMFVCLSTVTFIVESTLENDEENDDLLDTKEDNKFIMATMQYIDQLAITFFTVEYGVRLLLCPRKKKFIIDQMNLVDLIAIIPFYISLILEGLEDMEIIGKAGKIIRLIRILRILRIFKMIRHFVGLQSLVYTLHQAYKDLGLILIMVAVTVLMFSSLVFAFERDGPNWQSWSFYDCIWWGLMTLTTVGYHLQPDTFLGKLACGLCALCGIFIITLPIPIVVSSFAVCYRSKLWRNEIATRKRLARGNRNVKEDIIFNLATSSGMSGVRVESEILRNMGSVEDEYEQLTVNQNKYVIHNMATPATGTA